MTVEASSQRTTWQDLAERFVAMRRESETQLAPEGLVNPSWVYTDPEHFAREWEMLFRRSPVAVGLAGDLRNVGDYVTAVVGGTPIMVVRSDDGSLKAMVNICRHRGTRLVDLPGNVRAGIRCPYHAWTYDLDGRLMSAPHSGGGFDPDQLASICLPRLPVWERHGIIYTAASADGIDESALDDLDLLADDFAAIQFENFTPFREQTSVWPFNWKLAVDAFLEHYHIFSLHRRSVAPVFVPVPSLFDERGWNSRMCAFRKHTPESTDGLLEDDDFRSSGNLSYILFPNAIINMPVTGYVELWQILPEAHDRVRITSRLYVDKPVETAKALEFWNKNFELSRDVNLVEDFPLQQTVHNSLATGELGELIYGRNEPALIYFHQLLPKRLGTSHG